MTMMGEAVLVVEDDPDLRALVELVLDGAGYRVISAADGRDALEKVGREMPGVILLDMKMPRMNGWEFVREFRARHGPLVPIVIVTADYDAGQRAAEGGAAGYLGKPFNIDELLRVAGQFMAG